jgi:hypothetical protein
VRLKVAETKRDRFPFHFPQDFGEDGTASSCASSEKDFPPLLIAPVWKTIHPEFLSYLLSAMDDHTRCVPSGRFPGVMS